MHATHSQPSQARAILEHLEAGHTITPGEALKRFRCMRLGARIKELRSEGVEIFRRIIKVRSKGRLKPAYVAEYSLRPFEDGAV